jgi:hypothetical protein
MQPVVRSVGFMPMGTIVKNYLKSLLVLAAAWPRRWPSLVVTILKFDLDAPLNVFN